MASLGSGGFAEALATGDGKPIQTESAVFLFTAATGVASGIGNYIASQRLSQVNGDTIDLRQMMPVLLVTLIVTALVSQVLTPDSQNWPAGGR